MPASLHAPERSIWTKHDTSISTGENSRYPHPPCCDWRKSIGNTTSHRPVRSLHSLLSTEALPKMTAMSTASTILMKLYVGFRQYCHARAERANAHQVELPRSTTSSHSHPASLPTHRLSSTQHHKAESSTGHEPCFRRLEFIPHLDNSPVHALLDLKVGGGGVNGAKMKRFRTRLGNNQILQLSHPQKRGVDGANKAHVRQRPSNSPPEHVTVPKVQSRFVQAHLLSVVANDSLL